MTSPDEKQRQLDVHRVDPCADVLTTDQGDPCRRHRQLAAGGRARPDAAGGLPLPREDHPLRPRAHPGAGRPRARRRRARLLPGLRVAGRTTRAREFLHDPSASTPVFVRFSTVAGLARLGRHRARRARLRHQVLHRARATSTSSATTCRSSSSRTAIKFPDFVHAVKPEPHNEIPQAASAHDTLLGLRLAAARDACT